MELKFEKLNGLYVAEFEATSDFNLHVERNQRGAFTIAQRGTKQGKYAYITDENYDERTTIDVDMLGNIYPKYIKVTSVTEPTYAEVNMKSEGGGSGDGGMVYVDLRQFPHETVHGQFRYFLSTILFEYGGGKRLFPTSLMMVSEINPDAYIAGAFDKNIKISTSSGDSLITIKELIESEGISFDQLPFITEEEFYNLLNS